MPILTFATDCRGNVDEKASPILYPEMRLVDLVGWTVLLLHIAGMPPKTTKQCQELVNMSHPDIVVFGHSHKHGACQHEGVLYINPGSAGKAASQSATTHQI